VAERRVHHVSSAVVSVRPESEGAVLAAIGLLENTEVAAAENGRIVVVMEGASTRELGDRLTTIAVMDGVLAANMVFEHAEELEATES
jgi:nitrate reductase NapD